MGEEQPVEELSEKNDGFGNDGGPGPPADWSTLGSQDSGGGNIDISASAWPDSPAFSDAPQPALPAKQRPRPASVARERVANSLMSVARPRPGSSLAAPPSLPSSLLSSLPPFLPPSLPPF